MRTHLKDWREQSGLSQRQAARQMDLPESHYSRIETGAIKNLRASTIQKIVDVTGLSLAQIEGYIP